MNSTEHAGPNGSELSERLGPVACATCGESPYYTKAHIDAAVAAERERCAKLCEPKNPRPCDCDRCDCGNATDARMVAEWDEAAAMARRIRGA